MFDKVLVAVGRRPNGRVIGAEAAGVFVDERGFVPVDKQQRTNVGHIFAIGDVVGQPMLAHKATHEGKVAAENCAGHNSYFDATVIPSVAYTDPEVAWVGVTENEAKAAGVKYGKGVFPWAASGRSLSLGRDEGLTKVLFDESTDRIIGAGIVGPQRGDLIAEAALAIETRRRRRRHRADHPPPPDPVGDRGHGRRGVRRHHHRPLHAQEEEVTGSPQMPEGTYELVQAADGYVARIHSRGSAVLATPTINRGTAFTHAERRDLGLTGLLPSGVSTLDGQLRRTYAQYREQANDLRKWVYLANLRDRNEVLFYKLLSEHIEEMLPVVYTPTVGLAIERFSHEFRRTRGVYLSVDHPDEVELALRNTGLGGEDVDLLVATDSEGILGIGDQGVGGIEISVGKLAVYTAAAGIHPSRVLPVVLDMGTDNLSLLNDEMYLGERHARVRDGRYDQLIDAYVTACQKLFPQAMLHWEDFGASNARRILNRYADQVCTFNDDMQGTAAVVLAAAFSAVRAAGSRMRDQRVVIHGSGTAGLGIADMMRDVMVREGLSHEEATRRFYPLGRNGLIADDRIEHLYDFQVPYAHPWSEVKDWGSRGSRPGLADVVRHVHPTMLIGTSTQAGAFTEEIVRDMAAHTVRPIIMPLSNPTSQGRGSAGRRPALDRRQSAGRNRQPVRTGGARRRDLPHRPGQQCAGLSRPRARRDRRPGEPDQRPHDRRRGGRGRQTVRRHPARGSAAAAGERPAARLGRRRHRGRPNRRRGGIGPGHSRQPHPAGAPGHVAPGVPAPRDQAPLTTPSQEENQCPVP